MPKYYFPQDRMSVLPLMPMRPTAPATPRPLKEYHTQIEGCTEVAGCAVKDKKVKLTAEQAQYWVDQGVLGDSAGEHKAGALLEKKSK